MSDGLYDWLLFLHIVAAMVWVGGAVLLGFIANMRVIGPLVLAPATIAVVGFGVWLVLDSPAWDFGQFWVQLALALFAGAFVIGAAHQSRAAIRAERAAATGDDEDTRRQRARWSWGCGAIIVETSVSLDGLHPLFRVAGRHA